MWNLSPQCHHINTPSFLLSLLGQVLDGERVSVRQAEDLAGSVMGQGMF